MLAMNASIRARLSLHSGLGFLRPSLECNGKAALFYCRRVPSKGKHDGGREKSDKV